MKVITYEYYLSINERDRIRVKAMREKRNIIGFVAQYEAKIADKWYPVIRYDTSHGFAHKDILHIDGRVEKQPLWFPNLNIAFTYAIQDLKIFWTFYRTMCEKEVKNG